MDTKIHEIISILPADLQQLLLQHEKIVAVFEQIVINRDYAIANLQKEIVHLQEQNIVLQEQNVDLQEHNTFRESEIKRLKNLLRLYRYNSSKPLNIHQPTLAESGEYLPSEKLLDRFMEDKKGHSGTTLKQVPNPDHKKDIKVSVCEDRGKDLSFVPPKRIEKRQVFDIPNIRMEVTNTVRKSKNVSFVVINQFGMVKISED